MRFVAFLIVPAAFCCAQRLHVYSPLTRVDPTGAVYKADRGAAEPRHILSPGVPRNGSTPLRIVVEMDKPDFFYLDIGQNPENAVNATLYKENFVETANGYVPDSLQEVRIPYQGYPTDFRLPGQKVVSFWLDMYVAKNAAVERIKVEPQLYIDALKDWMIYPMEVRIQEPVFPDRRPVTHAGALPPASDSADAVLFASVQSVLCERSEANTTPGEPGQLTNRQLLRRYAVQDLALARDRVKLQSFFVKATGRADVKAWCAAPSTPPPGPEWYLRFRDAIYREAGAH